MLFRSHGVYRNVSGIERFFRNIFVHGDIHYDKKEVQVKHRLTEEEAERLYRPFCKMLEDAQIYPSIRQILKEVGQGVGRAEDEVLRCFQEMNDSCAGTVEAFKRGIDDRGYYEEQLAEYGRIKALTAQIEDASKDFLDTWALVLAE